ncbi:hypothetical protein J7L48_06920 [bacterium]|nr:hypothetical protein [bacterium]
MSHILLTDDKFFTIYEIFGFQVKVVNKDSIDEYLDNGDIELIFVTEGFYEKIYEHIKRFDKIPIIPIPDLEHKGKIAENSIDNMLKRFLGGI